MIQLEGASFRYQGSEESVLDNLDLTIQPGEWLAIGGLSGCGKSTLALAIAGFLEKIIPGELEGNILFDKKDIRIIEMHEIAEKVYLVQQNPENQFCTLTVRDELAFGLENRCIEADEIEKRTQSALAAVKAKDLIDRRLDELSGGQQQKIAIATALALQPEVLILDEPTSNLDPEALQELLEALEKLRSQFQMSVVIIEHRQKMMRRVADRLLEMHDGRLFEGEQVISYKVGETTPQRANLRPTKASEVLINLTNYAVHIDNREIVQLDRFELHSGEILSLMGPNGSGKTSLLLSLLGLLPSVSEQKNFFGAGVDQKLPRDNMLQFGLAYQNPDHQIFCDSVREEVTYGPHNYSLEESYKSWINELVETFHFRNLENRHPYLLSYGQKGRLNLASILAYKPRILLLDEMFIGQDYENVIFLLEMIRDYVNQQDGAAILVNHLANPVLEYADRLVFLEAGRKIIDCRSINAAQELKEEHKEIYLMESYG